MASPSTVRPEDEIWEATPEESCFFKDPELAAMSLGQGGKETREEN